MLTRYRVFALMAATLAGCGSPSPQQVSEEAGRLRRSFDKHRAGYLRAIETGNVLAPETVAWLDGPAIDAPRAEAAARARMFMDRWARVYFAPRYMHGAPPGRLAQQLREFRQRLETSPPAVDEITPLLDSLPK